MAVLTETRHTGCYIVSEAGESGYFSRERISYQPKAAARSISGTVIGRRGDVTKMSASVAAASGNTGNGVLSMAGAGPLRADAIQGSYQVVARSAGATADIEVIDPRGVSVGVGKVGTLFDGPVKFTLANGATPAVIGDRWLISVVRAASSDLWGALDLTQTTGWQTAAGILFTQIELGASPVPAVAHLRQTEVRASDLTWPAGITAPQLALATDQLRAAGIILR